MVNLLAQRINQIKADTRYVGMKVNPCQICDAVEVTITYYRRYNSIYANQNVEVWVVANATEEDYLDPSKTAYRLVNTVSSNITRVMSVFGKRYRRWMRW